MPPEDSDSVRFSRKMGCNSTASAKAMAMTNLLIGCLWTQPWSVTGNNDIPLGICIFQTSTRDFTHQWRGKIQASPTKTTLMLLHKLFMDTEKLLPRAEANPWFGDVGEIYGECGAPAYVGDLGASPPVVSSGKAPGEVRGLCLLKLINSVLAVHQKTKNRDNLGGEALGPPAHACLRHWQPMI